MPSNMTKLRAAEMNSLREENARLKNDLELSRNTVKELRENQVKQDLKIYSLERQLFAAKNINKAKLVTILAHLKEAEKFIDELEE